METLRLHFTNRSKRSIKSSSKMNNKKDIRTVDITIALTITISKTINMEETETTEVEIEETIGVTTGVIEGRTIIKVVDIKRTGTTISMRTRTTSSNNTKMNKQISNLRKSHHSSILKRRPMKK